MFILEIVFTYVENVDNKKGFIFYVKWLRSAPPYNITIM